MCWRHGRLLPLSVQVENMGEHLQNSTLRERECLHRSPGLPGTLYPGEQFVSALHRLRGEAGLRLARKVQPFFWADAPLLRVWLCEKCSAEAGLNVERRELDAA